MKTDEEEGGWPWKIMEKNILGRGVAGAKTWRQERARWVQKQTNVFCGGILVAKGRGST